MLSEQTKDRPREVVNPADVRAVRKQDAERRDMYVVWEFVRLHQNSEVLTANTLRDDYDLPVAYRRVRPVVTKLLREDYLYEDPLPKELRKGPRTTRLKATGRESPVRTAAGERAGRRDQRI